MALPNQPPHVAAFAAASTRPYWLDRPIAPQRRPPLSADTTCDLAIVGGGFTGLWAALLAKEEDPSRDVVILEGDAIAEGASGRNGGFVEASLTHGLENGLSRFPDEIEELERLGRDNMAGLEAFLDRHGIDAAYEKNGMLVVAREPHEEQELAAHVGDLRRFGYDAEYLGLDRVRQEVDSPTFRGALWQRTSSAIVDPAKLAWGLAGVAQSQGVRIHEGVAGH